MPRHALLSPGAPLAAHSPHAGTRYQAPAGGVVAPSASGDLPFAALVWKQEAGLLPTR
jgi:hypothetical protein